MKIHDIAEKINSLATERKFKISQLQELRKEFLHKKKLPQKIFSNITIFDNKELYAFHHGGRVEMQFNFGEEIINGKTYTRYAICFSLVPSHSLSDPVSVLKPIKDRFNEYLNSNSEEFKKIKMWYYKKDQRSDNYTPHPIPEDWFQINNFIAIGNLIEKPLSQLNEDDLIQILNGFDNYLPIYKYCVLENKINNKIAEKRIARICWNENNWSFPSGRHGKSPQPNSHERLQGYGLEEWLFDIEKVIDGYHYVFLQPIQKGRKSYLNKHFDINLYSRNSETGESYWIGYIKNLEVISKEDANKIYTEYNKRKWLQEMTYQIKSVDGNVENFNGLNPDEIFNARFNPKDALLFNSKIKIEDFEKEIKTPRYQFIKTTLTQVKSKVVSKTRHFKFKPSTYKKSFASITSHHKEKAVQSEVIHNKIQEILYNHLISIYDKKNVGIETSTGLSTRIDVSVKSPDGIILYEIKTFPSVLISIRNAIGQLLEYAYYPNPINGLKNMVIVSHLPIDIESKEYLSFIRKKTSLRIFYLSVDIDNKRVSDVLE